MLTLLLLLGRPRPGPEGLLPCRWGDHLHQRPQAQARGRVSYLALFSCFDATIFIVRCSFAVSLSLATAAAWSTPWTSWTDPKSTAAGSGWSRRAAEAEGAAEGPGPTAGPGIDFYFLLSFIFFLANMKFPHLPKNIISTKFEILCESYLAETCAAAYFSHRGRALGFTLAQT